MKCSPGNAASTCIFHHIHMGQPLKTADVPFICFRTQSLFVFSISDITI